MDTIYVSGIPKGLNSKATSLLIRKHIESVAQVNKVWMNKDKGCGHVTLFDSTSVDMVLSLDGNIKVNGCPLRLYRKRELYLQTKPRGNHPEIDLIRSHGYTRLTKIAYETYAAYKKDVPQTDMLYQYAKPVPPRCQRKQRKPWKDTARITSIQTPKGGKVYKRRRRRKKKKQQSRSQRYHCGTITSDRKKEKYDCRKKSVDIEMKAVNTQETSDTGLAGDGLVVKPDDGVLLPSNSRVHVYDHGRHVCDIYVDNDNVAQSIIDGVSRECKIPVPHLLLWYNGQTINDSWPLYIENGDNIHLSVKGKGGMMKGKTSGLQRDFVRFDYSGYFKINVVSKDLDSTSMIKLKIEEEKFVKFCHFFTCDLQLRTLKKALEYKWRLDIVQTGYPPTVCQQRGQAALIGEDIKELLTNLCFQLDVIDLSSTAWDIKQIKQSLSSLDSYQNGRVIGYDVSGDTLRHWIVGESGSIANVYETLNQELGDRRSDIQPDIELGQAKVDEKQFCGGNDHLSTSTKYHPDTTEDSVSMNINKKYITKTTCQETESIPSPVLAKTDSVGTVPQVDYTQDKDKERDEVFQNCDNDDTKESIDQQKEMRDVSNPGEVQKSLQTTVSHYEDDDNAYVSDLEKGSDVCSIIQKEDDQSKMRDDKGDDCSQSIEQKDEIDNNSTRTSKITEKDENIMTKETESLSSTLETRNEPLCEKPQCNEGCQTEAVHHESSSDGNADFGNTENNMPLESAINETDADFDNAQSVLETQIDCTESRQQDSGPDNDITELTGSSWSSQNQNESTNKELDISMEQASKDIMDFSELMEDQKETIEALGLKKYFPSYLTFNDVMEITKEEKENKTTVEDVPFIILRKLIMLDYSGRENVLHELYGKKGKKHKNTGCKYNPIDIILSIFLCLHPSLKSILCSKMFMCHIAMPLIYNYSALKEKLTFWKWPLHTIVVNNGDVERCIVNSDQYVVSFVRLGRPQISKSKIANAILHETTFDTFFNYDCKLGSCKKRCSKGLIEAAWYMPSSKENDTFNKLTMILNLRGDLIEHERQLEFLKTVSNILMIVTDKKTLEQTDSKYYMGSHHVVFLMDNSIDDDDDDNDDDDEEEDLRSKTSSDNEMLHYVNLKEDGQQIGMSEIKESVLSIILSILSGNTKTLTIAQMCIKARALNISIDEDECGVGNSKAEKIFALFKDGPLHEIKTRFTPLQTDLWKVYSDTEKEHRNGNHLTLHEKNELSEKMTKQRKAQVEKYKNIQRPHPIEEFLNSLVSFNDINLYYFLETFKMYLDEKKRKEIPAYQTQYNTAYNCQKTKSDTKEQSTQVQEAENNLRDASFGMEHLFRELGQIFEAHSNAGDVDFHGCEVAKAVAKSIMLGYPLELMDGDVANIPLGWIKQVFSELKNLIGDKKIVTLSILGLESSGKSTLLNAMFGLSFSVSVGRCTRGINMRMLPVQKGMFDFDYVLVVDTEGLRTTELGRKTYQQDNALATVVIGMADISIINIKGENTSEIKDILQICVHAFLRLQLANNDLKLRQSCIFIHQNVPALNAKKSMSNSLKKLEETLDRITLEAAEEENISDITRFSDVIEFDINKHVWYFPDLWKGDPPMAPVNPGYSNSIRDVKNYIIEKCTQTKTKHENIESTFVHLQDLWNGILANDFVFSFRNSLEMKNYKILEGHFNRFVWDLELSKLKMINTFKVKSKQFTSSGDPFAESSKLEKKTKDSFNEESIKIKERLISLFKDGNQKSGFMPWKNTKLIAWENQCQCFESNLSKELTSIKEHCLMDLEMKDQLKRNKREIVQKTTELAEKTKGKEFDEKEMAEDFGKMWNRWIEKWNVEEKHEDINETLDRILKERFLQIKEQIDPEKKALNNIGKTQLPTLENSLDTFDFKTYITVKATWYPKPLELFQAEKKKLKRIKQVVSLINVIFTEIDTKVADLSTSDWRFNETEVKEITTCITKQIDKHNDDKNKDFKIQERCKILLHVAVFKHCLPIFEKLNRQYLDRFSMKAKLIKERKIVWKHFCDTVQQKASDIVARNRFCDVIREHVEEYVRQQIPDSIYSAVIIKFSRAKHELCVAILEDLAKEENFYSYLKYIRNPSTYAFKWMEKYISKTYFEKPDHGNNEVAITKTGKTNFEKPDHGHNEVANTKTGKTNSVKPYNGYYEVANTEIGKIVAIISETAKKVENENIEKWLSGFQNEIKEVLPVSSDTFDLVRVQAVSDMEDFLNQLIQDLENMSKEIKEKFLKDTVNSIIWPSPTPYKRIMDTLWGCECVCPFCYEPCQWNSIHTNTPHSCIQHRPKGLGGMHWETTEKLLIESCSFNIQSNAVFECGTLCKRELSICKTPGKPNTYHPFRQYKKYVPDWNIHPCHDISSSKYWAWVFCTFNEHFANFYHKQKADIPSTWKLYKKEDAIKSLRQ